MTRFGFPRQARLVLKRDFERLRREGRRLISFPLVLRALPGEGRGSRMGLAVSRKVGGAVVRNRWKRAVREAFRLNRHRLARPYDIVVSVSWDAAPTDLRLVEGAFIRAVERLNAGDGEAAGADTSG